MLPAKAFILVNVSATAVMVRLQDREAKYI